ncbi:Predicted transcriptional regulator [Halogranum amylolyticum]|uniref:Predicted transcriptional regulator n=1 Tax=Halogranum amylolyticum TaxID=660520 RepID=A0A1H8WG29_9EURY|nr:helix-turn-helix transcriptional regulator [Halogranum amylolyticum]SEP26387.1 Predicted transcriptional regulator [Halogranum amylolyticum]
MSDTNDDESSIETVTGVRRSALEAIAYLGGEAPVHDIMSAAEIAEGSRTYVFRPLRDQGLIEQSGEADRGTRGPPGAVYRLTDAGREVLDEHVDAIPSAEDVTQLRDRVDELERENELRRDEVKALVAALEDQGVHVKDAYLSLRDDA